MISVRGARPGDFDRLRELTFESKSHWGYERDFMRRWADRLTFDNKPERWVAERNAAGFYGKMGGRFLRTYVTEWGREGQRYGMEL